MEMGTQRLDEVSGLQALVPFVEDSVIDLRYFVMLTEPNCELKARDHLKKVQGFDPYVPIEEYIALRTVRTRFGVKRCKVPSARPIFRGYLFLPLNRSWSFGNLYRTPGLRQNGHPFLMNNERPVVLDSLEVEKLKRIEYGLSHPERPVFPFKLGDRVKVMEGPFEDCIARISALDDAERITLLMEILGRKTKFFATAFQIATA